MTVGNAFYAIGTPEALKEAVASYDQAIDHYLQLPRR